MTCYFYTCRKRLQIKQLEILDQQTKATTEDV